MSRKFSLWKVAAAAFTGILVWLLVLQRPFLFAVVGKARGADVACPWNRLLKVPFDLPQFIEAQQSTSKELRKISEDTALDLEQFQTQTRPFWIKSKGELMDGRALLAYVIEEQAWIAKAAPEYSVRPGDVVVDVGAHVGTFGDDALRLGAKTVVMVEPDPVNVECIRRNFADEIKSGRVIVAPEGAWDKDDTISFFTGVGNSGTGSLVVKETGSREIKVRVRVLDEILRDLHVTRVDFIKMDIEGAERHALQGAAGVLRRDKPRLMLDMYHLPDDTDILPKIIHGITPEYQAFCGPCGLIGDSGRFVPNAVFWK